MIFPLRRPHRKKTVRNRQEKLFCSCSAMHGEVRWEPQPFAAFLFLRRVLFLAARWCERAILQDLNSRHQWTVHEAPRSSPTLMAWYNISQPKDLDLMFWWRYCCWRQIKEVFTTSSFRKLSNYTSDLIFNTIRPLHSTRFRAGNIRTKSFRTCGSGVVDRFSWPTRSSDLACVTSFSGAT